ncbi:hypothetical protein JBE27_02105 [Streptomyces albiflaviniger]|nr:hypothetical protein [Streptomyces albiflaviniger]
MNALVVASGALALFAIVGGWVATFAGLEAGIIAVAIRSQPAVAPYGSNLRR